MAEANLLAARAQGRNRFYRLASPEVAHAIESLMALAGQRAGPASKTAAWRRDPDLRFCRTCYDHLAGQVGIAVTDSLTQHGHLEPKGPRDWKLTNSGELFCHRIGVDLELPPLAARDDIKKAWGEQGAEPFTMTTKQFGDFIQAQIDKWSKVIEANHIPQIN